MKAKPEVVIIGAGGHAKAVISVLQESKSVRIAGCTDHAATGSVMGVPILGDDDVLPELYAQGLRHAFIAVGDNRLRSRLARKISEIGFRFVNAISPHAYVADSAALGDGIAIMPGAVVQAEAAIGSFSIINTSSSVDHESIVGESVHIAPGSHLSGRVSIGEGTFLGTGTTVIDGITIGEWSVIGAGGVVVRNIPGNSLAYGVPAKVIKAI